MIINLFRRKNAKPKVEVIRKAPSIDPVSRQKYKVSINRVFMDTCNWTVHKNGNRIGVNTAMNERLARIAAEDFIIEHEFNGKTMYFDKVTYEVTVNRFEEADDE